MISPFSWVAILLIAALLFKKRRKACFTWAALLFLFFSNPFIINKIFSAWETDYLKYDEIKKPHDVGIMLGGTLRFYHGPLERPVYGRNADRFVNAVELYKRNKIRKILISGGSGKLMRKEEIESTLLEQTLLNMGVPKKDIILETQSRNTYQNAKYSAEILKAQYPRGKFLLITSSFHMRRSKLCFDKQGIETTAFPVDQRSGEDLLTPDRTIIPDAENFVKWTAIMHEWVGIVVYKIVGYI